MFEKSTQSIVDGEKDKHVDHREHQTGMDTGVKGGSYFGHVVRAGGMEDDVMLGRMNGARKRGRPRQMRVDTLKGYASGATISDMRRDARERESGMKRSYHGCRQGSDATRWHKVTR